MIRRISRKIHVLRDEPIRARDPFIEIGSLAITGSAIGGVLSIGLFLIAWTALPVVRPFLAAALISGGVLGLALWLKRR